MDQARGGEQAAEVSQQLVEQSNSAISPASAAQTSWGSSDNVPLP